MKLIEERIFNLLNKTERDTPKLAARADFITPKYIGLSKTGIFHFKTNSQSRPGYSWYQTIEIKNLRTLAQSVDNITPDLIRKWFEIADVNLYCSCESYLYWAFQFMGTQRDYNDPKQPETRAPKRNNTKLAGGLCKHLTAIAEHLEAGEYYEQMAKDVTNWSNYTLGNAYKSFNRGRNMGQYNKREKEIDWKSMDSFVDKALWAQHNMAKFLRQNNIKRSINDEIDRLTKTGEELTLDEFLEDEFGITLQDLANKIGVEEKDLDDYFKQTYGLTNTEGTGNLS
ncbi:MAG: hypothetical protein IJF92_00185 [Bacilli bacterium]|nr:hypothetical protein [Bacilli bacterium]MBQ3307592.1 hypothetical protein [Bacilli bacterium]